MSNMENFKFDFESESREIDAARPGATLLAISARLVRLAAELAGPVPQPTDVLTLGLCERGELSLLTWAEAEYDARRQRSKYLPASLFGEPSWDILLDLFIHQVRRKRVSVTDACHAGCVPHATALRWIGALDSAGLIKRLPAKHDRRVQYLELTPDGTLAVSRWLQYRASQLV